MLNSEVQGSSDGSTSEVTGGKAAVSGVESGHFRRQFHQIPLVNFPQNRNQSKHKIPISTNDGTMM